MNEMVQLTDLAAQINQAHEQAETALRAGLEHAKRAGELLLRAKEKCGHGGWLPWLKGSVRCSERTAQAYMRIAREWDTLTAKAQRVADLSYRDGLKLLTAPAMEQAQPSTPAGRRIEDIPFEDRKSMAERWWDLFAAYVLVLDAEGREPEWVAEFMGMPVDDVERVLSPRPPLRFNTVLNGSCIAKGEYRDAFEQSYRDTVGHIANRIQRRAYNLAAHRAKEESRGEAVVSRMEAMEKHYERQGRLLQSRSLGTEDFCAPENFGTAIYTCALTDARIALGIENSRDALLEMIGKYEDAMEVVDSGDTELIAAMDSGKISPSDAASKVKRRKVSKPRAT